jgi:hypothetical protein
MARQFSIRKAARFAVMAATLLLPLAAAQATEPEPAADDAAALNAGPALPVPADDPPTAADAPPPLDEDALVQALNYDPITLGAKHPPKAWRAGR